MVIEEGAVFCSVSPLATTVRTVLPYELEVDAQIAVIAELGAEAGVATPLVSRLVELVHDVEEARRPQSWETLAALE